VQRAAHTRADPHLVLAAAAGAVVALEAAYSYRASDAWLLLEVAFGAAGLLYAWHTQERLRLLPLLAVALAFQLAYVSVHLGFDVRSDFDSRILYHRYGAALLDGDYPRAEYPVGAVLLFAFESLVSGGGTRVANAFTMIPFQLAVVAGLWWLRSRFAPWLAALVALFPLNPYYVEFKFDPVTTALLVVGLVLAQRQRWGWAGAALGVGALAKWTPGLTFLVLFAWLLSSRNVRGAVRHGIAFAATVVVVHVPFLLWEPRAVLHAYSEQGGRKITPESLWYLPLHAVGRADVLEHISKPAGAPEWANVLAAVVQAALVIVVVAVAVRMRGNLTSALALAALAPAVFLLTNRIFSPQFILVLLAAWATAGALLVRNRREQVVVGIAAAGASLGNAFVYPYALPWYTTTWQLASATLFALGAAVTVWLAWCASGRAATNREAGWRAASLNASAAGASRGGSSGRSSAA
jgi:hypothetical protein